MLKNNLISVIIVPKEGMVMLNLFKKELNISLIASIIYIVIGIVVIARPEATLSIVSKTIALLLILYGIVLTVISIRDIKEENTLIFGVLAIVMGIALLIYPNSLSILISLGLGIWFISSSVTRMKFSVLVRDITEMNWLIILISSIITLIIGISFVFMPLASAVALTKVSGIMMIVYSVIDLFEIIIIKMHIKSIEDAMV